MGLGVSILLIAAGAILAFAVNTTVSGVDIQTVGWILLIVGIVGAVRVDDLLVDLGRPRLLVRTPPRRLRRGRAPARLLDRAEPDHPERPQGRSGAFGTDSSARSQGRHGHVRRARTGRIGSPTISSRSPRTSCARRSRSSTESRPRSTRAWTSCRTEQVHALLGHARSSRPTACATSPTSCSTSRGSSPAARPARPSVSTRASGSTSSCRGSWASAPTDVRRGGRARRTADRIDPVAFDRVAANLILNALRYGAPPVEVSSGSSSPA